MMSACCSLIDNTCTEAGTGQCTASREFPGQTCDSGVCGAPTQLGCCCLGNGTGADSFPGNCTTQVFLAGSGTASGSNTCDAQAAAANVVSICGAGCCQTSNGTCTAVTKHGDCIVGQNNVTAFIPGSTCCDHAANATQCTKVVPQCPSNDTCSSSTPCGTRPGCHGGLRDGRECRDDYDCPSDPDTKNSTSRKQHNHEEQHPVCVPLSEGCQSDLVVCRNCTLTIDNSRISCATCLICTDDEVARGRGGCCQSLNNRHKYNDAWDDDDDERSDDDDDTHDRRRYRPECNRAHANYTEQCGRKFTCECAYRPCRDRYDVFGANDYFDNVCHAARHDKLQQLSRRWLPDGPAVLFTDGSSDFYFVDARDTKVVISVTFLSQLHSTAKIVVSLQPYSVACPDAHTTEDEVITVTPSEQTELFADSPDEEFAFTVTPGQFILEIKIIDVAGNNRTCAIYDIGAESHAPICPDGVPPCSLPHCFSARECPRGASLRGCDSRLSRCIESIYGDDHDDDDLHDDDGNRDLDDLLLDNHHDAPLVVRPQRADCVCDGADDGQPCTDSKPNGSGMCVVGKCKQGRCSTTSSSKTFDCDCVCAPRCHVDSECGDGNPNTDDFCIRNTHQCVHSPALVHVNRTQPTPTPTPSNTTTNATTNGTVANASPSPTTTSLGRSGAVRVTAAAAPATEADRKCSRVALDSAERAFAAAAMDRSGGFDADGQRMAPICYADELAQRPVTVSVQQTMTELESKECCGSRELRGYCLGGATTLSRTAQELSNTAFISLDSAHRESQAGAVVLALRDACCAAMMLESIGAQCGREGDLWALANARVVRVEAFGDVGARCMAADDGHPDKDLNDFVFELRRVDLFQGARLVAVNLHTMPLAHGGGHTTSLVVATGDGLSLGSARIDNNECSERLHSAMPVTESVALLKKELGYRTPALPAGSFGAVVRHALHNDGLPHVVESWTSCTTFGPVGVDYCQRGEVVPLYENTRWSLPVSHPDALEWLAESAKQRSVYRELTTNTQRGTRRVRSLYAVSATIVVSPPRDGDKPLDVNVVRLLLRNEDCGVTALFDSPQMLGDYEMPLSISVPAAACAGWRWAAEGQPIFAVPSRIEARFCRGGDDSALATCTSTEENECAEGGLCAQPLTAATVPYPHGWQHFQCAARGARCDSSPNAIVDPACCTEEVRRWYAHVRPELVYDEQE
jgi:hypothetical protein